jgi:hypothetical protein
LLGGENHRGEIKIPGLGYLICGYSQKRRESWAGSRQKEKKAEFFLFCLFLLSADGAVRTAALGF